MAQLNSSVNPQNTTKQVFKVLPNTGIEKIGQDLKSAGLINNSGLFALYAKLGPSRGSLKPGAYLISPSMSLAAITDLIGSGKVATQKVTFQEGLTVDGMARKWAREGLGTAQEFVDASKLTSYNQSFLQYRKDKRSLEGYLFPSTYEIVISTSPQDQINTMLNTFASQVLPNLDPSVANSSKLNDLIILASIVEKEARTTADRKLVASVFYNRLAAGMKLESDVTINYVTGKTATEAADLKIRSEYNSYLNLGLPPTPICNPSLDAILATANPSASEYFYFIADRSGIVHFAKSYQEHLQNIEKYLN